MFWHGVDLSVLDIQFIDRAEFFATWGKHMQLWRPEEIPPGSRYARLFSLAYESNLPGRTPEVGMAFRVTVLDRTGEPVVGCPVAQGWIDGPQLPPAHGPRGGDPRERPLRGNLTYTNKDGVAEWTWGPGEGFNPSTSEGAHWIWIPAWQNNVQCYTDVAYGFGWELGTDHHKMLPIFVLYEAGSEPPPEPTIQEAIGNAADLIGETVAASSITIAEAIRSLAAAVNRSSDEITSLNDALAEYADAQSQRWMAR